MADRKDKRSRNEALDRWKANQRATARAKLPLPNEQMRAAMRLAMSLWPGEDERSVFLTPEEMSRWHAIYEHPEESFWWFANSLWPVNGVVIPCDLTEVRAWLPSRKSS